MIHTLKQGSKSLGVQHENKLFIVGFRNVYLARKVQYTAPSTITNDIIMVSSMSFDRIDKINTIVDPNAILSLPKSKNKGGAWEPVNDMGLHLHTMEYNEFVTLPFTKGLGIVIPYDVLDETGNAIICKSTIIFPTFNVNFARNNLRL